MTTLQTKKQLGKNRSRRWTEKLFLLAGLAAVGVWAWSIAVTSLSQDWENWVFDRELQGKQAFVDEYLQERAEQIRGWAKTWLGYPETPKQAISAPLPPPIPLSAPPPTKIETNALVGCLSIPRLHLTATVREGAEEDTLRAALGHIPSTSLPGQAGNGE